MRYRWRGCPRRVQFLVLVTQREAWGISRNKPQRNEADPEEKRKNPDHLALMNEKKYIELLESIMREQWGVVESVVVVLFGSKDHQEVARQPNIIQKYVFSFYVNFINNLYRYKRVSYAVLNIVTLLYNKKHCKYKINIRMSHCERNFLLGGPASCFQLSRSQHHYICIQPWCTTTVLDKFI